MKSLALSCLLVGFCLVNYFADIWLCSLNPFYSAQTALVVFTSPMFVLRGTIFDIMQTTSFDWIIDLILTVGFWTLVIHLVKNFRLK